MPNKNKSLKNKGLRQTGADHQAPFESRIARLTLIANLIPTLLLLATLWYFEVSIYLLAIVAVILLFLTLYSVSTVWSQAQFQFRSLHNLLEAIVHGDYSFRGVIADKQGAFGELIGTINELARTLQKQRRQSEESQLLVQKVVDQIDVAILAWDDEKKIHLINPAASTLLSRNKPSSEHSTITTLPDALNFTDEMRVGETQVKLLSFHGEQARYRLHLERFISEGGTHQLLFLTDISNILRREEKRAWRNLVRVLSHEINNSLTPLKSFSATLSRQIEQRESDDKLKGELLDGMSVIRNRTDSLVNFVKSYNEIAKLPEPNKQAIELSSLIEPQIKLFEQNPVSLRGDSLTLDVDASQIEQVLINLLKNAAEASEPGSPISIGWTSNDQQLTLTIEDQGIGIQSSDNLFTPYYTTKKEGSGIGLVLCQQIIEAHGGSLSLANSERGQGCVATITLPLH